MKIEDSGLKLHAVAAELSSSRSCAMMMKLMESVNFALALLKSISDKFWKVKPCSFC